MSERQLRLSIVFAAIDKATSKLSGINKSAATVGKALDKARKELEHLNDVQGDINSFRKLKGAITDNTRKLDDAQEKVSRLAREMKQAERPTREMERAFKRAQREAREFSDKVDEDSQSVQRLRDKLRDAGVHTRDLAKAQKDLKKRMADATREVEDQKDALAKMGQGGQLPGQSKGGTGKGGKGKAGPGSTTDKAVTAGIIVATAREAADILAAPAIAGANAQEQMTQIGLKANLSREEISRMRAEIERMAPALRQLPENVRGGVDYLAASGLDPRAALKMIDPIGKAAHAYKAEITDLAQGANAALTNLKVPLGPDDIYRTRETTRILDMLAIAANEGNFEFNDMARHFPTLTARLAALDQKGVPAAANLGAALQVAFMATGDADKAANNIDNLLLKINAKETVSNFKKFGIDLPAAMKKAYAEGKGPLEAIAELTEKATGGNTDKLSYLFGDAQAQTGVLSMIQNMKEFRRIRDAMLNEKANGQIERDFTKVANDTSSRWDKFSAQWNVALEKIGQNFEGVTNAAISGASWALDKTIKLNDYFFSPEDEKTVQARSAQIGAKTGDALAQAMQGKRQQLQLSNWWLTVQDATTMRQRSITLGNNVGDGLVLGMRQRRGQVQAAAAELAAAADGASRKRLEVHSPSRVFMAIGQHVAQGLALGIDRGKGDAVGAAQSLASGVAGAGGFGLSGERMNPGGIARGGGSITQQFGPVTIVIHAAPGQSPQDIAAAVSDAMRDQASGRGAANRSAFSDV